jgi:hypothetical protein
VAAGVAEVVAVGAVVARVLRAEAATGEPGIGQRRPDPHLAALPLPDRDDRQAGLATAAASTAARPRATSLDWRDYELRLYHYYPNDDDVQAQLQASVAGAPVEFTATPELLLDSRYDLKRIPFRTGAPVPGQRGVLTLRRRRPPEEDWEWDLDIGLRVRAAWIRQTLFGVLVAAGLAVPPIVAAYQNSKLSNHAQHTITFWSIVSAAVVAAAAAFGLRRSL